MKDKKPTKQLIAVLLCISLLSAALLCFFLLLPKKDSDESSSGTDSFIYNNDLSQIISSDDVNISPPTQKDWNKEVRGVWVASVLNIDFPSSMGLQADKLKNEIDTIVSTCAKAGINTIYFQVRPSADALYKSSIYPVSVFLTGKQGSDLPDGFDPLAYFIEKAHMSQIELHAWINPYRVTGSEKITLNDLSDKSPAKLHPDWVKKYNNKYYFDPGIPEVRQLVIDGVAELISNYNVDGVHFDDYFYPGTDFDDQATFEKYKGSFTDISDWRRENNSLLIKAVYEKIKSINADIKFGISPMGIWANKATMSNGSETKGGESYSHNYADTLKWINDKIVDYVCPQLYWTDKSTASNFNTLLSWWSNATKNTGVDLLIGHALYKLGDSNYPDFNSCSVITNQLDICKKTENYCGSVFYNYSCISDNKLNICDAISKYYCNDSSSELSVSFPENNLSVEAKSVWISGTCNPKEKLYINNTLVTVVSNEGYYSSAVQLNKGVNTITLKNGKQEKSIQVTRTLPKEILPGLYDCFPDDNNVIRFSGDALEISATAPENSTVTATINNATVALSKDESSSNTAEKTVYKGTYTLPVTEAELNLGKVTFSALLSNKKKVKKTGTTDVIVKAASQMTVGRIKQNSWLRPISMISNFLNSFRGYTGYTDYIVGEEYIYDKKESENNTFVKFKSGFWTQKNNVDISDNKIVHKQIDTSLTYTYKNTVLNLKSSNRNPVKVEASSDKVIVYIYNGEIAGQLNAFHNNPLFESAVISKSDSCYTIELKLKRQGGYLGSSVNYTDTNVEVLFKNPCKIIDKDKPLNGIKIALDPGHGAQAGANCPDGSNERELNYKFVKKIEKQLVEYGANVTLSRNEESTGLETKQVPDFYYDTDPDLAVSIHHNSIGYESLPSEHFGFECYYASEQSKMAAQIIFEKTSSYTDRKISQIFNTDYIVSRVREFPSVLLEVGYLSNVYEYSWLKNENNSDLYAKSIAVSIVDYFKWQNDSYK